jgi:hypothetical protein
MSDREVSLCKWKIKIFTEKSVEAVFAGKKMRRIPIEVDRETVKRKFHRPQLQNVSACYKY